MCLVLNYRDVAQVSLITVIQSSGKSGKACFFTHRVLSTWHTKETFCHFLLRPGQTYHGQVREWEGGRALAYAVLNKNTNAAGNTAKHNIYTGGIYKR